MTTHDLAKKLLEEPNITIMIITENGPEEVIRVGEFESAKGEKGIGVFLDSAFSIFCENDYESMNVDLLEKRRIDLYKKIMKGGLLYRDEYKRLNIEIEKIEELIVKKDFTTRSSRLL